MPTHDTTTHSSPSLYDIRALHPLAPPSLSNENGSSSSSVTSSSPSSPPIPSIDDVTTIFIVGFPEDMQEREFQNMFIFSKGFEAASLKWHFKEHSDYQDMFGSILTNKKQMIGFARFRTRQEANEAALAMNGKKVDMEKGSALKAEMAKKNLHIKRSSIVPSATTSTTTSTAVFLSEPFGPPMTAAVSRRLSQVQKIQQQFAVEEMMSDPVDGYESFSPLPSDLLSPDNYKNDPFLINEPPLTTPNTPSFCTTSLFGIRSHHSIDGSLSNNNTSITVNNSDMIHTFQPFSSSLISFNTSAELDADPFINCLSKSTPVPHHDFVQGGFFSKNCDDLMSFGRKNSLQPPFSNKTERSCSMSSSVRSGVATNNPADQNPPCNTLYVGNLPPATGEEELRSLFANCQGYKRMCFRNKPQGPMCFVEFNDVFCATQAMNERQGHVLSNSIKGGIRLSFSKNPLFIKPNNKEFGTVFSFRQMGTALLADL